MIDTQQLHDQKYREARDAGFPGWGGAKRIAGMRGVIDGRFLSLPGIPKSGHLLEIGCGAGNVSLELAARGYEVVGVDFSNTAIRWAIENAKASNASVDFHLADVTNLSIFKSDSFDLVYDGNCIHCLVGEKRSLALTEIHRLLKPEGVFFVSSLCSPKFSSDFPASFDPITRILFEGDIPYRFIPPIEFLSEELIVAGFKILKKSERQDSPFSHVNFHLMRT